jgi:hypothetical protein
MNLEEDEMTTDRCWECRRMIYELENLGVKFANCETCKDATKQQGSTIDDDNDKIQD